MQHINMEPHNHEISGSISHSKPSCITQMHDLNAEINGDPITPNYLISEGDIRLQDLTNEPPVASASAAAGHPNNGRSGKHKHSKKLFMRRPLISKLHAAKKKGYPLVRVIQTSPPTIVTVRPKDFRRVVQKLTGSPSSSSPPSSSLSSSSNLSASPLSSPASQDSLVDKDAYLPQAAQNTAMATFIDNYYVNAHLHDTTASDSLEEREANNSDALMIKTRLTSLQASDIHASLIIPDIAAHMLGEQPSLAADYDCATSSDAAPSPTPTSVQFYFGACLDELADGVICEDPLEAESSASSGGAGAYGTCRPGDGARTPGVYCEDDSCDRYWSLGGHAMEGSLSDAMGGIWDRAATAALPAIDYMASANNCSCSINLLQGWPPDDHSHIMAAAAAPPAPALPLNNWDYRHLISF